MNGQKASTQSVRVSPSNCPVCKAYIDAATCLSEPGARPNPGDFTYYSKCLAQLRFNNDMSLRLTTKEDDKELPPDAVHTKAKLELLNILMKSQRR